MEDFGNDSIKMRQNDPCYWLTFKKAILVHIAIDIDVFTSC